jgi:hypothetical protein
MTQSMTMSQIEIDKEQPELNSMEIITGAEMPRPMDGKRVMIHF